MALGGFGGGGGGAVDALEGVGVVAGVEDFGAEGHGGRGEVLDLLEVHVESAGDVGQAGHVFFAAAGVGGDEVRDELLVEAVFFVDLVEDFAEFIEEGEVGLAHQVKHVRLSMFRGHFESPGDMAGNELLAVLAIDGVSFRRAGWGHGEVIAHSGADECFLDGGHAVYGLVDLEQARMVVVEIRAGGGMQTAGAQAFATFFEVAAAHGIHVGAGSAEVADIALEVRHLGDGLHLAQDRFGRAGGDEFALVGGDGAEGAPAEASAMKADGMANHLVSGNGFAAIARMRQAGVRQVKRGVDFGGGERRIHGVDLDGAAPVLLIEDGVRGEAIALLLNVFEVGGLLAFVA